MKISNEELIRRAKAGDNLALDQLLKQNEGMCMSIVKKYIDLGESLEDLMSVAKIGLLKAYDSFNLDKGYKYSTYAYRSIQQQIFLYLRHLNKWKDLVSLNSTIKLESGDDMELLETLESDTDIEQDFLVKNTSRMLRDSIKDMAEIKPNYAKVIILRYFKEHTFQEVAYILNMSRSWAEGTNKRALKKLKSIYLTKARSI